MIVAAAVVAACNGSGDRTPAAPRDDRLVIASFNFDESRVVAEIYAQALEEAGVDVRLELDLGPRELMLPALRQGFVDVVPEYLGTLFDAASPGTDAAHADPPIVVALLAPLLDAWGLTALEPSPASNQNALVVTRETAETFGLTATSDLVDIAARLTIGGPPECPSRPRCLPGLERAYSLQFATFLPFGGSHLVEQALLDGVIDVGVLFTTDGALASEALVVLEDDRALQPAENLVPVVRTGAATRSDVVSVLDAVSAQLTTSQLRFLNWRVSIAGNEPAAEARGWLIRHGLVTR